MSRRRTGCGLRTCDRCRTACPTGALVEPGVLDARRCLAWLVQTPGTFPEEYRRALGGRIYGCDECQQVCPINRLADRRHRHRPPRPTPVTAVDLARPAGGLRQRSAGQPTAAGTSRPVTPGIFAAMPWSPSATSAIGGRPGRPCRCLRHWMGADDAMLAEHARWAASPSASTRTGLRPVGRSMTHLLGDQRLPTEGGGDPGVPVGAVAATRSRARSWCSPPTPTPTPRHSTGPRPSGASASSASRTACWRPTPRPGPPHPPDGRTGVGAELVVIDPAFPLGVIGPPSRPALRAVAPRCRGRHPRSDLPAPDRFWPMCSGTADWSSRPVATRPPRAARALPSGGLPPVVEIPPGVDLTRFVPLDADEREPARSGLGLPVDGPLLVSVSRLVPAQGHGRAHRCRRPSGRRLPRADGGHRRPGPGLRTPGRPDRRAGRPGAPARRSLRRATSRAWSARPTSSSCCAATGGSGSSRRDSASSSSRPRQPGFPRWRGPPAAPARPSRTDGPAWWSRRPTDVGAVSAGHGPSAGRSGLRAQRWGGIPATGRGILRL